MLPNNRKLIIVEKNKLPHSLTPTQGVIPLKVEEILTKYFDSLEKFKEEFTTKALGQFGSGWAWLVQDKNQDLKIITTSNAQNPLKDNLKLF